MVLRQGLPSDPRSLQHPAAAITSLSEDLARAIGGEGDVSEIAPAGNVAGAVREPETNAAAIIDFFILFRSFPMVG